MGATPALQVTEEKETNENAANFCSFFLIPTFNTENKTPKHSEIYRSWRWKRPICLELEESLMKKLFHPHRILKSLIPPKRVSTRNILHLIFAGNLLPKSQNPWNFALFSSVSNFAKRRTCGGLKHNCGHWKTGTWQKTFVSSFSNSLCRCFAVILRSSFNVDEFHISFSEAIQLLGFHF